MTQYIYILKLSIHLYSFCVKTAHQDLFHKKSLGELTPVGRAIAFELLYNQQLSEVLRIKGSLKPLGLDSEPSGFVLLQKI